MKPVIFLTERAAKHLKEVLVARAKNASQCLRLVVACGGEAGLVLDEPHDGDEVVEVDGVPVLLVPIAVAPRLRGATLDYVEKSGGSQLMLARQHALPFLVEGDKQA